jgi:nucleoside-diphosphate-sugar epimerase
MAMAQRICVTGASGKAGRAVVRDLLEHGYDVAATDVAASRADIGSGMLRAELTDYGQAVEALRRVDAVVHLANIPAPGICTPAVTFNANITMNFNVFQAAAELGLSRVVWASSETTLGLPFEVPPRYAPVDEDHYPLPTARRRACWLRSSRMSGLPVRSGSSVPCSRSTGPGRCSASSPAIPGATTCPSRRGRGPGPEPRPRRRRGL